VSTSEIHILADVQNIHKTIIHSMCVNCVCLFSLWGISDFHGFWIIDRHNKVILFAVTILFHRTILGGVQSQKLGCNCIPCSNLELPLEIAYHAEHLSPVIVWHFTTI